MNHTCLHSILLLLMLGYSAFAKDEKLVITKSAEALSIHNSGGEELLKYWSKPPSGTKLSVESACFFHPLTTPSGIVVTDLAPSDHPHHRGIFLGWVEMHGTQDADFWGWGEHAPKKGRSILNKKLSGLRSRGGMAAFRAENAWVAEGQTMLVELLQATFKAASNATILDVTWKLTPSEDIHLSQWAFGGFCVRTRGEGSLTAANPSGTVQLPNPKHTEPKSNWPDAAWYDFTFTLPDGKSAGVAVISHPENPPELWHNHREVRMINPCITSPGQVQLTRHKPLTLRYRVVAHDGPAPKEVLDALAAHWSKL